MSESTLIIERHSWRGWKTVGGDLGIAKTRGFWTFTYCPFLLSAWLEAKMDLMRDVLRGSGKTANGNSKPAQPKVFPSHRSVTTKSPQEPK